MRKNISDLLEGWPRIFIHDSDLKIILKTTNDARHSLIKRLLKSKALIRIRKGLYLITSKTKQALPDEFELASLIYEPSFISLESALSYHNLIPEAVYITTCVSPKRAQEFKTPIGIFSYTHVPEQGFYTEVRRVSTQTGTIFVAEPWRALADMIYTRHKIWKNLAQLEADLRIDINELLKFEIQSLELLSEKYASLRVRKQLKKFLNEITKNLQRLS